MYRHKKKFSQHFLHDDGVLTEIIEQAGLEDNDIVWEVGAGLGSLTEHLLNKNINLTIFEIDNDLIPTLTRKYGKQCVIIHGDVLKIDWKSIAGNKSNIKIVTNLPYQITSPFLYKITENHLMFDSIVIMLQKEVAKRVCAMPGNKDYGVLSLKTQFFFNTNYLFDVSPDKFSPPPKVFSAVIRLTPRKDTPVLENIDLFWQIIEASFRMKRKTLKNNLESMMRDINGETPFVRESGERSSPVRINGVPPFELDLNRRGESLSEEEFIFLYNYFLQYTVSRSESSN